MSINEKILKHHNEYPKGAIFNIKERSLCIMWNIWDFTYNDLKTWQTLTGDYNPVMYHVSDYNMPKDEPLKIIMQKAQGDGDEIITPFYDKWIYNIMKLTVTTKIIIWHIGSIEAFIKKLGRRPDVFMFDIENSDDAIQPTPFPPEEKPKRKRTSNNLTTSKRKPKATVKKEDDGTNTASISTTADI